MNKNDLLAIGNNDVAIAVTEKLKKLERLEAFLKAFCKHISLNEIIHEYDNCVVAFKKEEAPEVGIGLHLGTMQFRSLHEFMKRENLT